MSPVLIFFFFVFSGVLLQPRAVIQSLSLDTLVIGGESGVEWFNK